MDVGVNTLVQRNVPLDFLGRVLGSLYGAIGVASALAHLCRLVASGSPTC